jgi:hypothetical protein
MLVYIGGVRRRAPMKRRLLNATLILLSLAPSIYVGILSRGMPQLGRFQDDGLYWVTAKSLATGSGYRILSLPGQPHQTKYPPLYPLLLSLVWKVQPQFPENIALATGLTWIFLPVLLLLSRRLFNDLGFTHAQTAALLLLIGWCPVVAYLSVTLMTEILWSCLILTSLSLAEKSARAGTPNWHALVAGLLAGAAFLTKTAAAPLLVTVTLCLLARRQRARTALFLCGMLPAVAFWTLWVASKQSGGQDVVSLYYTNYLGYHFYNVSLARMPSMLWRNAAGLLAGIGSLIAANVTDAVWLKAVSGLLAIVSIAGLLRLARRGAGIQHVAFALAFALALLFWHFPPNDRFLMPVYPILLAGFMEELRFRARSLRTAFSARERLERAVACLLAAVFLAFCLLVGWATSGVYRDYFPGFFQNERAQLEQSRELYSWVRAHLPRDASFLAYRDTEVYLYSERCAVRLIVPPMLFYDHNEARTARYFESVPEFLRRHRLSHLLFTESDKYSLDLPDKGFEIVSRLTADKAVFQPLYKSPLAAVYVLAGGPAAASSE